MEPCLLNPSHCPHLLVLHRALATVSTRTVQRRYLSRSRLMVRRRLGGGAAIAFNDIITAATDIDGAAIVSCLSISFRLQSLD